ncbi:hypothetical protein ES708_15936 [subsurface metagenome]|jgi:hypothetical protein
MAENYMKDEKVRRYYDFWIKSALPDPGSPNPLGHPSDRRNFYAFVKACIQFAEHKDVRRKLSIDLLEAHLYDDLHGRYTEKGYDLIKHEIIALFENLLDYEDATLIL